MNLILTCLQHDFHFHLDHNSDLGTNIIEYTYNSDKVVFRWQEREVQYRMDSDEPWIPCTFNADLHNAYLHSIIQLTEW